MNQELSISGLRATCGQPQCFQWLATALRKNLQFPII